MRVRRGLAAMALLLTPIAAHAEDTPPISIGASYITDVIGVAHGGKQRGVVWLGRADATASVDGGAIGLDGVTLFVDVMGVQKPDFSGRFVGDAQTVSNVQANSAIRPYEAWIGVPVTATLYAKAGLIDLNSEFDVQSVGGIFLNSSFGIGPDFSQTGVNGPSIFPAPATAGMVRYTGGRWTARLGVFDAVAGSTADPRRSVLRLPGIRGALIVAEADRRIGDHAEVQLGLWHYTTRFASLDPAFPARGTSQGGYAQIEGDVASRGDTTLSAWARIGTASDRVNQIGLYLGGGAVLRRGRNTLGIGIAHARLGDPARLGALAAQGPADRAETTIELTFEHRLLPGVIVQPDVQYVFNPGWAPEVHDALVTGMRFRFAYPPR